MEIAFYPSDILIRGSNRRTAWTHGFLAEALAGSPGLQTFDPVAQDLERQIRRIWQVYRENPTAHEKARGLLSRHRDVIDDLGTVKVDYDDWQVLYRQTLQLERALHGQPQLLQSTTSRREAKMKTEEKVPGLATAAPAAASTGELVSELFKQSAELVKKEVALARSEVLVEVKQEVKMVERLGVAAVCALCGLNLLLVAAAMGLAHVLPAWAAALVVAGVVLLIGALAAWMGWEKRVKRPLERTQRTLKEDVRWAKERLA